VFVCVCVFKHAAVQFTVCTCVAVLQICLMQLIRIMRKPAICCPPQAGTRALSWFIVFLGIELGFFFAPVCTVVPRWPVLLCSDVLHSVCACARACVCVCVRVCECACAYALMRLVSRCAPWPVLLCSHVLAACVCACVCVCARSCAIAFPRVTTGCLHMLLSRTCRVMH